MTIEAKNILCGTLRYTSTNSSPRRVITKIERTQLVVPDSELVHFESMHSIKCEEAMCSCEWRTIGDRP